MTGRLRRAAGLAAAGGMAVLLAGCSGGPGASPAGPPAAATASLETQGAATSIEPSAGATDAPAVSTTAPPSAPATLPGAPPEAVLSGLVGGQPATGALGSYTWSGSGSDAPWVVGQPAGPARPGSALTASFSGASPASWTAAWARVAAGYAGDPVSGVSGTGAVAVAVPDAAGDWSLQIVATFGPGANAAYYWRLTVTP